MTDSSTQGHTRISLRTMEHIVAAAIASVPGTKAIEAKLAGIGGRGFPRASVQMDPEREVAAVNATIGVVWPSPVTTVAEHTVPPSRKPSRRTPVIPPRASTSPSAVPFRAIE